MGKNKQKDTNKLPNWQRKVSVRLLERSKQVYHTFTGSGIDNLLFIFGCQRSGTTITQRIFEQDWNTKIYPEVASHLSKQDTKLGLRLDPVSDLKHEFSKQKAPFVITKPLVESQNAQTLLKSFPGSKALWMYRHYGDVAASKLKKSGMMSGVGDLRYIHKDVPNDWRNDQISDEVRHLVNQYFSEDMDGFDAAALYWYVRNQFYFQQDLANSPNVMLVRYDDLVGDSANTIKRIYNFLERPFPGENILIDVHKKSIGKGKHVSVSPSIQALCDTMFQNLLEADQKNRKDPVGISA
ncbi:MAG: sulfotransferase [Chloroflexota bacterium]